ncbi:MAG TPA: carboxypeptidase regulatory-like domain-containing protein [Verrucomicrobiae bacterium]|nr:carboxypeptidase regulatory-like domain-containing protein [Verrucomicrobiae bacterium]
MTASLHAQTTGTISGTVTDPTGAVVPKAKVVLKNQKSTDVRQTVSNGEGAFSFGLVVPGTYDVTIEAQGFKSWEAKGIQVNPGDQRVVRGIAMAVGVSRETVTVTTTASTVDSGERSALLNSQQINNLSLESRDVTELIKIMPGMAVFAGGNEANQGFDATNVSVGSSTLGNGYIANGNVNRGGMDLTMDGAHIVDPGCNCGSTQTVFADTVAEVKVQTSNFGADSAKGPVVINAIGKSGSSAYHGEAYLYTRNTGWNSNRWDNNNVGQPRGNDKKYYPGAQIGGPVPGTHKKLVFFTSYNYYYQQLQSQLVQAYVPTDSMRKGNFTSTAADNFRLCSNPNGGLFSICSLAPGIGGHGDFNGSLPNGTSISTGQPNAGIIPASAMDPGGVALMKLYPEPNTDPLSNSSGFNFVLPLNTVQNGWAYHTRIDYNYSDNTKIYVTYNQQRQGDQIPIRPFFSQPRSLPFPGGIASSDVSHTLTAHFLHTFSPSLTNDVSGSLAYVNFPIQPNNPALFSKTAIGYPYHGVFNNGDPFPPALSNSFFLTQAAADNFDLYGGKGNNGAFLLRKLAPTFQDDVTWAWSKHIFKFGLYWERTINDQSDFVQPNGEVAFDNFGPYFNGSANNALANQLFGAIGFVGYNEQNFQAVNNMSYRSLAFYVADSWKLTKKLTLDLGLRFTNYTPWRDDNGLTGLAVFQPSLFQGDLATSIRPGLRWNSIDPSVPKDGAPTKFALIDPRFGVAWDAFGTGKTILRGGFGAYHFHDSFNDFAGALSTPSGSRTFHTAVTTLAALQTASTANPPPAGAFAISPTDDEQPVTYSYNFTISQQGPKNSTFEFAYVGNHSSHLMLEGGLQNLNLIPLGGLFGKDRVTGQVFNSSNVNSANLADFRPFGTFTAGAGFGDNTLNITRHGGNANYNAFQASWNKQQGRFTYGFNYTFSKALGLCGTSQFSCALPDPTNIAHDYGILSLDRSHIFNSSYQIDLGQIGKYLRNTSIPAWGDRIVDFFTNGWTIAGITSLQSGPDLAAFRTNFGVDNIPGFNNPNRQILGTPDIILQPVLTCDPTKNLKPHQYVNGACFAVPGNGAAGTLQNGQYQLPYIKGPAFVNSDLSLYKSFKINERQGLQLRASAFNFLNHPLVSFNPNGNNLKLTMTQSAPGQPFVNTNSTFGFTDIKFGQRIVEVAARYTF